MNDFNCNKFLENNWYYVSTAQTLKALEIYARDIDFLIPFWYGITDKGTLVDQSQFEALLIARRNKLPIIPIVHNFSNPKMAGLIHEVLTSPNIRQKLIFSIETLLLTQNYAGVNIDFEFVPPEDRYYVNTFMEELYHRLSPGFRVTISVPAQVEDNPHHPFSGAFDYNTISRFSDELYILAYDEHFSTPGPVASIGFVRRVVDYAITKIPRHKIKLGMAVYGYDWVETGGMPRTLSFQSAVNLARKYGATITYDDEVQESTFTYIADGVRHIVWFEDSRSFSAKLDLAICYNLGGIGVWRLGLEDPEVWGVIRKKLV
ncbi:Spore germination protein YaaH [Caldanaerovirga acetigignens]|uniref:Spore germination protein YaaH n=1 Tax=Caldanaerovirga acetigignens TaxID=447595 RepID=A0A1M7LIY2_9FIRM|nr:glycosyl hydrolase family 18 protein [Caldanaerovirga acetigignens]SHM78114.1 Spore germination protein YaaH [Caldanaerovirga acetigignens]